MIVVTGGTGTTGALVARDLLDRGHDIRVVSRRTTPRFDWADPTTYPSTVQGARAFYLLAPIGVTDPAPLMLPFLTQARDQGVQRVVLLSSSAIESGPSGLGLVHARLPDMFPEWAVLRPSWFMENFVGDHAQAVSARTHGEIVSATAPGRVAFIDPADIAAVAVQALTDPVSHNTDHLITGPAALTYDEVATLLGVRHRALTETAMARYFAATGVPAEFAAFLATLDTRIAQGAESHPTDTVQRITGRPPTSFADFLHRRRSAHT